MIQKMHNDGLAECSCSWRRMNSQLTCRYYRGKWCNFTKDTKNAQRWTCRMLVFVKNTKMWTEMKTRKCRRATGAKLMTKCTKTLKPRRVMSNFCNSVKKYFGATVPVFARYHRGHSVNMICHRAGVTISCPYYLEQHHL